MPGTLTKKLLLLIGGIFLLNLVVIMLIGTSKMSAVIDASKSTGYKEKLGEISRLLEEQDKRLRLTRMEEAYLKDFQTIALKSIAATFSQDGPELTSLYLIDRDGTVLFPDSPLDLPPELLHRILAAGQPGQENVSNSDGGKSWIIYRKFSPWNWTILYRLPYQVKYAALGAFKRTVLPLIVAVGGICLLLLYWLIKRQLQPIQHLTVAASAMAEGNYASTLPVLSNDEIGLLTRAFEKMRLKVHEQFGELRLKQEIFEKLTGSAKDGIIQLDHQGKVVFWNQAGTVIFGYSREEIMGADLYRLFPDTAPDQVRGLFPAFHESGYDHAGGGTLELEAVHKNGSRLFVELSLSSFELNGLMQSMAVVRDVTARKQEEERMALMSFAMERINELVFLVENSSRFQYVNEAACRALGYSRDDLLERRITDIDHGFPQEKWPEHWLELQDKESLDFETVLTRQDGSSFPVSILTNYFEFNRIGYSFALAVDISQQKQMEEERLQFERQLMQTQKLESLGVLAGGIAHDFNNLLAAIIGHSELTKRKLSPESAAVNNLNQIEQAAERAADLAKQMLAYSGRGKFVIEPINLNQLLEEMLHMLEVSISKKAVLRLHPYAQLPAIEADATQIRQVIMNLVINASEAIGEKSGIISITTGCMDCDESYLKNVWLNENLTGGLYVYLEIADTGCGIAKDILPRIFDPFFTTKFTGRGLGMSAVMGIIRGHNGAIKVYSEPGKGTTFKILLPASDKPAEIFNGNPQDEEWVGSGKVLLVDDEESVRGIGVEMLKELGFVCLTADNGREALEVYRREAGFTLVILDLTMPKMDGEQCFRELRVIDPEVKVIISSGYNEYEVSQKFIGKGISGFVQKPYKLSALRDAIKGIVDPDV